MALLLGLAAIITAIVIAFILVAGCASRPATRMARSILPPATTFLSPLAPTNFHALAVNLVWGASITPNVTGYRVYHGAGSRDYTNVIDVGMNLFCTVSNLNRDITNYFAATALVGLSESDYSTEAAYLWLMPTNRIITVTPLSATNLSGPWTVFTNWPAIVITNPTETAVWKLNIIQTNR